MSQRLIAVEGSHVALVPPATDGEIPMCANVLMELNTRRAGSICTREAGHTGAHIAHRYNGNPMRWVAWAGDNPSKAAE